MKTRTTILAIFGLLILQGIYAQNNALVIRNDAFIVINGGTAGNEAVLVIDQSNANGIITSGTGGNIVTQGEFDYIKWNVQTGSGTYTIPFTTDVASVKIPLSINITAAGTGSGYMALSSWDVSPAGGAFDNTPYPSEVVHMAGANGQADVSDYAVDRFWIIDIGDPLGTGETYTSDPTPTMSFGYNTAVAETGDGNNLAVGNLGAQRYNGTDDKWYGWFTGGVPQSIYGIDNGAGTVSGVTPPANTWYRTWTLADYSEPLPVEMVSFNGVCEETGVLLRWETASEINNDYFEVQKSVNGVDYEVLDRINGAGNTSGTNTYEYIDADGSASGAFYKVVQVDNNGEPHYYDPIRVNSCYSSEGFNAYPGMAGEVLIEYTSYNGEDVEIVVYDALGKQISLPVLQGTTTGFNKFSLNNMNLAFGSYLVVLRTADKNFSKKLILN